MARRRAAERSVADVRPVRGRARTREISHHAGRREPAGSPPRFHRVRGLVLGRHVEGARRPAGDGVRTIANVRQAYDALWLDWEKREWRFIGFWSHPVQYRDERPFDDLSSQRLQYGGLRVEHKDVGPGDLSASYSRFIQDDAQFLD